MTYQNPVDLLEETGLFDPTSLRAWREYLDEEVGTGDIPTLHPIDSSDDPRVGVFLEKISPRAVLSGVLPEGITYQDLYPETPRQPVEEQLDPLADLLTALSTERLQSTGGPLSLDEIEDILEAQDALRESYRRRLQSLLLEAERRGPEFREEALERFQSAARNHLQQAHAIGLSSTARGRLPTREVARAVTDRTRHDSRFFNGFLQAIWDGTEVMPRPERRDLYVQALDSLFSQGALSGTSSGIAIDWVLSPAIHCLDCIRLASGGPYHKPGDPNPPPDTEELPTVPRRGDTTCLSKCKCELRFWSPESGEELELAPREEVGAKLLDEESNDPVDNPEWQEEADSLHREMAYHKAMFDLTGQRGHLDRRKAANQLLIGMQDRHGLRILPRATSDAMSKVVEQLVDEGWDPAIIQELLREDVTEARLDHRLGAGMTVVRVFGRRWEQGTLLDWDGARGTFESHTTSRRHPVSIQDDLPTILLAKGAREMLSRPWHIPPSDFQVPIAGFQVSYAEQYSDEGGVLRVGEFSEKAPREVRRFVASRPRYETHGLQYRLEPPEDGRPHVSARGPVVRLVGSFGRRGLRPSLSSLGARGVLALGTGLAIWNAIPLSGRLKDRWQDVKLTPPKLLPGGPASRFAEAYRLHVDDRIKDPGLRKLVEEVLEKRR